MIKEILGMGIVFIIPGILISKILFKKLERIERIIQSFIFSVVFSTLLGLILGFNEYTYGLSGGLDKTFIYSLIIITILLVIYIYQNRKSIFKK